MKYVVNKRYPSEKYRVLGPVRPDGTIKMGYGGRRPVVSLYWSTRIYGRSSII